MQLSEMHGTGRGKTLSSWYDGPLFAKIVTIFKEKLHHRGLADCQIYLLSFPRKNYHATIIKKHSTADTLPEIILNFQ